MITRIRVIGRNETVPSLLDRNYATGLAAYVAAIWFLALIWIAVRRARHSAPAADGEG